MSALQVLQEMATKAGIPYATGQQSFYALKEDYPVQFFEGPDGNGTAIWGLIRYDDANKDRLLKEAIHQDKSVSLSKLKKKAVNIADGIVSLKWAKGLFGYPKPDVMVNQFSGVFNIVKSMSAAPGLKCRECGSKELNGPVLINGIVDRMCPKCIEDLKKNLNEFKAAYEALPVNYPLALAAAIGLAIVGALLWGGVIIATNKIYWVIALAVGLAIGWVTTKAAGKGGLPIQIIVFSATILSVFLGMVFFAGYAISEEAAKAGYAFDVMEFLRQLPAILTYMKGDLAFSLVGGGIGAFYAAVKAGKPDLSVKIGT